MLATFQAARLTYFATFHSHLSYGLLVWGCTNIRLVFLLQKRAIRVLSGAGTRNHCRPFFKEENVLTLPSLYFLTVLTSMFKNVAGYSKNNETHGYKTRKAVLLKHMT